MGRGRDKTRKSVRVLYDQLSHPIIGHSSQVDGLLRLSEGLNWWRMLIHLNIVAEAIHHFENSCFNLTITGISRYSLLH